jgi:hypothetical protein
MKLGTLRHLTQDLPDSATVMIHEPDMSEPYTVKAVFVGTSWTGDNGASTLTVEVVLS